MNLGIPPVKFKNLLESNPLKSRFVVSGLTVEVPLLRLQSSEGGKKTQRDVLRNRACTGVPLQAQKLTTYGSGTFGGF